jgi:DNA-(apurinic or apyrimidinic site) lyase
LRPLAEKWPFGRVATLYVVLGLNNFQTKGRAEVGYWPKVVPLILEGPVPLLSGELREVIRPFFRAERMALSKLKRLDRFLDSGLCREIWKSDAHTIANEFLATWEKLACTMNQKREQKRIVYALKCLAYALIMVDEFSFRFESIPIPVDSRVRELSARLDVKSSTDNEERARWNAVLACIAKINPSVTMIHLDSVLWQIGTLQNRQIEAHLLRLGTPESLSKCLAGIVDPAW